MIYVALLRGINVGGNSKVDMKQLKVVFEELGLTSVKTYINSGNVIFKDASHSPEELVKKIESAIEKKFGFNVKVLIRDLKTITTVTESIPSSWKNDSEMKCDVMFLWETVDSKNVLKELIIKKELDEVKYVAGSIIWKVDRKNVTRSGLLRIVGTALYKQMTIRNCNTVRKLFTLMKELE